MIARILAGLIGLAILLPIIVVGGVLAIDVVCALALGVMVWEYGRMAFPEDTTPASLWQGALTFAWCAIALYAPPAAQWPLLAAGIVATMLFGVSRAAGRLDTVADAVSRHIGGAGWLALLGFLPLLRRLDDGLAWVFLVLTISWMTDTGAYFAGRAFGRTPMAPVISPKKTWEGFVGGVLAAVVGTFVVRWAGLPTLGVLDAILLGVVGSGLGVLGDLAESMVKRTYDIKDASNILPGHGGLLDRVDSVLFVGPTVFAWAVLIEGYAPWMS